MENFLTNSRIIKKICFGRSVSLDIFNKTNNIDGNRWQCTYEDIIDRRITGEGDTLRKALKDLYRKLKKEKAI